MQWSKNSWRNLPIYQQPTYPDARELDATLARLEAFPPLIFAGEARNLKSDLKAVCEGRAFLLQGGDCAESFANFNAVNIRDWFKVMLQMSLVLTYGGGKPVVKVGRIAGQFAKPRSAGTETQGDTTLPSYRGDIINGFEFDAAARVPQPARMVEAYYQSAATLNLLRGFSRGGFADLHEVSKWNLGFARRAELGEKFRAITDELARAMSFMEACGISAQNSPQLQETRIYTSHEALLLPYEEAFTRVDSTSGEWYDCSAHMLWIGERTRGLGDAHVHFLSGVKNPLGVKISSTATADDVLRLCDALNPANEPGRLCVIVRMGQQRLGDFLPQILRRTRENGANIVWSIDPMHGNTVKTTNGYKTREFAAVLGEVRAFFDAHRAEGTVAGGVHLEMTGADVTECTGGAFCVTQESLAKRYETQCDPRLNADQALELAFLIADLMR